MIVALLNQKGGVGKTTLATHIAGELAMRGQSVILLDAGATTLAEHVGASKDCPGCSALSAWQGKPCTKKRQNSPGGPIMS